MINIYELLKDCQIGTKLYCTLWGESMTYVWRKWCDFEGLINEK